MSARLRRFRCLRAGAPRTFRLAALLFVAVGLVIVASGRAMAQDFQAILLGNGLFTMSSGSECVVPGSNGVLETAKGGDDVISGNRIFSGPNGICESPPNCATTPLGGDDQRSSNGVHCNGGAPFAPVIKSATASVSDDGLCNDVIIAGGDDVVVIPVSSSSSPRGTPRQLAIGPGANGTIQSAAAGDDQLTAVICPGGDNAFQSTPASDDVLSAVFDPLCVLCTGSVGCIVPGPDGILQTTAAGDDVRVPFVSTGADGVTQSSATGDDQQVVAVGKGAPQATCVNAGPNGIAETSLCGNAIHDDEENGVPPATNECDDGNGTSGDGCAGPPAFTSPASGAPGCVVETGWTCTGTPSVCTPICGDGLVRGGELCDDGNTNNRDDCTNACRPAACGDGIVKNAGTLPFEQCDDGNVVSGDGCDANCRFTGCGNGIVTAGETCDDGNLVSGDGCDANCTPTGCGNGIVTAGEQCDDGNTSNSDTCLNNCMLASCGDGFVRTSGPLPLEQCDDGNTTSGDGCDANCTPTGCGNGIITAGETCDDGNTLSGDCCSPTCQTDPNGTTCNDGNACTIADQCQGGVCQGNPQHCGDGVVQGGACGEECDDGNTVGGDGCGPTCRTEFCGDGIVNDNGTEECDDGNNRNDDACVQGCRNARCGDGFKQRTLEQCDDGNLIDGDGCSSTCTIERPARCGDKIVQPPEECDDGNNSNRDDCLNNCKLPTCGDGFVHDKGTGTEECDDGNAAAGDGCSPACTSECGNGVIDGGCSEPVASVGNACTVDADCDSSLAAGDGHCVTEECDPGKKCAGGGNDGSVCTAASACPGGVCAPAFCEPGPLACSNACLAAGCGNGVVECTEECDLGPANGVAGSGCTASCTRNLVGADELTHGRECPSAWTLDSPPLDLSRRRQVCADGASCDFDHAANGQCVFRVGVCLDRPAPAGCANDSVVTFDLVRLQLGGTCTAGKIGLHCSTDAECDDQPGDGRCHDRAAEAAAAITGALSQLAAPGVASVPDRCRLGLRGKVCSIPDNEECDRSFGQGDGLCDIGAGVEFTPPLGAADQITACSPGVDVVVDAGQTVKLRALVRRGSRKTDKDKLFLVCSQ